DIGLVRASSVYSQVAVRPSMTMALRVMAASVERGPPRSSVPSSRPANPRALPLNPLLDEPRKVYFPSMLGAGGRLGTGAADVAIRGMDARTKPASCFMAIRRKGPQCRRLYAERSNGTSVCQQVPA